jgi:xylose isomerase
VALADPSRQFAIEYKLKEPWLLDQFSFREDPVEAVPASVRAMRGLNRLADRLDNAALAQAQERQDAMASQRLVQDALYGALND